MSCMTAFCMSTPHVKNGMICAASNGDIYDLFALENMLTKKLILVFRFVTGFLSARDDACLWAPVG